MMVKKKKEKHLKSASEKCGKNMVWHEERRQLNKWMRESFIYVLVGFGICTLRAKTDLRRTNL